MERKRGKSLVKDNQNRLKKSLINETKFTKNNSNALINAINMIGQKELPFYKNKKFDVLETKKNQIGLKRNASGNIPQLRSPVVFQEKPVSIKQRDTANKNSHSNIYRDIKVNSLRTEFCAKNKQSASNIVHSSKVFSPKSKPSMILFMERKDSTIKDLSKYNIPFKSINTESLRRLSSLREATKVNEDNKPEDLIKKSKETILRTEKSQRNLANSKSSVIPLYSPKIVESKVNEVKPLKKNEMLAERGYHKTKNNLIYLLKGTKSVKNDILSTKKSSSAINPFNIDSRAFRQEYYINSPGSKDFAVSKETMISSMIARQNMSIISEKLQHPQSPSPDVNKDQKDKNDENHNKGNCFYKNENVKEKVEGGNNLVLNYKNYLAFTTRDVERNMFVNKEPMSPNPGTSESNEQSLQEDQKPKKLLASLSRLKKSQEIKNKEVGPLIIQPRSTTNNKGKKIIFERFETIREITKESNEDLTNRDLNKDLAEHNELRMVLSNTLKEMTKRQEIKNLQIYIAEAMKEQSNEFEACQGLYKIEKEIGKGCFGSVYRAKQVISNLPVALKVIAKKSINSAKALKRIEQEIAILKKMKNQKFVTQLLEVFEDDQNIFLVFEYENGGDLVSYFKKNPLLGEKRLKPFFKKLVEGLKGIHKVGVIHRDIKMDNILLRGNIEPVIADFGISSIFDKGKLIKDTGGTPAYLAPEVILAKGNVSFCSDVWSLGVLLYVLTFGFVPFQGEDIQCLYRNIIRGEFDFPEFSYISKELRDLIEKMINVSIYTRITINEIIKHPWLKDEVMIDSEEDSSLNKGLLANIPERITNEMLSRYLNDVGFPLNYIYKSIYDSKYNHVTACIRNMERNMRLSL